MNIEIDTNLFEIFTNVIGSSVTAFLPLIGSIMGIFIAFAIANNLVFYIKKLTK